MAPPDMLRDPQSLAWYVASVSGPVHGLPGSA